MKSILLVVFLLGALTLPIQAAGKSSTVLVHPGEVIYARFEQKGNKLKLIGYSKQPDDAAQVIFRFDVDDKAPILNMKVENKFPKDLSYKAELRSLSKKRTYPTSISPIVANKVAYDTYGLIVEEFAAYGFELRK